MNKKEQRRLISNFKQIDKQFFADNNPSVPDDKIGVNAAFFICRYCKNYRPIEPGTLIFTKKYNAGSNNDSGDNPLLVHDQTLARTKNYFCHNKKCKTHTDPGLKEAVLTKNELDQMVYVCTQCTSHWIESM